MYKVLLTSGLALAVLDFTARPAHAYLDPGVGSYAIQIALAGLAGSLYALRGLWTRLITLFRRKP